MLGGRGRRRTGPRGISADSPNSSTRFGSAGMPGPGMRARPCRSRSQLARTLLQSQPRRRVCPAGAATLRPLARRACCRRRRTAGTRAAPRQPRHETPSPLAWWRSSVRDLYFKIHGQCNAVRRFFKKNILIKETASDPALSRSRASKEMTATTAHHCFGATGAHGGKIVPAHKQMFFASWVGFLTDREFCSRSGLTQFKRQPGYHFTIVMYIYLSRDFQ